MIGRNALAAASLGALCLLISPRAQSAVDCSTLPSPIYVTGSSAIQPLIKNMGAALDGTITIVSQKPGSCVGVAAVATPTSMSGTGIYYTNVGGTPTSNSCNLDPNGTPADVGVSDVFPQTCLNNGLVTSLPSTLIDTHGPTQAMTFVVPAASTQTSIIADEAYFMFGWGALDQVTPWNDPNYFFVRNSTSGTQNILAYTIDPVDEPAFVNNYWAAKGNGIDSGGAGAVVTKMAAALTTASSPDLIIGILASEDADPYGPSSATPINQLGFRGPGQMHGYLPDSQLGAHDKINVRQGRYMPFGPLHMLAIGGEGGTLSPNAKLFIDLVLGNPTTPPAPFNALDLTISTGLTPDCAMEVSRTAEGGPVALYSHPAPCGCYFEFKATGSTTCTACTGTGQGSCTTAGQQCRNGYCESH
jgi:hypothetical protein